MDLNIALHPSLILLYPIAWFLSYGPFFYVWHNYVTFWITFIMFLFFASLSQQFLPICRDFGLFLVINTCWNSRDDLRTIMTMQRDRIHERSTDVVGSPYWSMLGFTPFSVPLLINSSFTVVLEFVSQPFLSHFLHFLLFLCALCICIPTYYCVLTFMFLAFPSLYPTCLWRSSATLSLSGTWGTGGQRRVYEEWHLVSRLRLPRDGHWQSTLLPAAAAYCHGEDVQGWPPAVPC